MIFATIVVEFVMFGHEAGLPVTLQKATMLETTAFSNRKRAPSTVEGDAPAVHTTAFSSSALLGAYATHCPFVSLTNPTKHAAQTLVPVVGHVELRQSGIVGHGPHVAPNVPAVQLQENEFTTFVHVPPFWHGELMHGVMIVWQVAPV